MSGRFFGTVAGAELSSYVLTEQRGTCTVTFQARVAARSFSIVLQQ